MVTGTIELSPIMQSPCRTEVKVFKRLKVFEQPPRSAKPEHMVTPNESGTGTHHEPIWIRTLFSS